MELLSLFEWLDTSSLADISKAYGGVFAVVQTFHRLAMAILRFHDPLAVVSIFEPAICDYKRGVIDVELNNTDSLGVTHFHNNSSSPMQFASAVDQDAFFAEFYRVFEREKLIELQ